MVEPSFAFRVPGQDLWVRVIRDGRLAFDVPEKDGQVLMIGFREGHRVAFLAVVWGIEIEKGIFPVVGSKDPVVVGAFKLDCLKAVLNVGEVGDCGSETLCLVLLCGVGPARFLVLFSGIRRA